MNTRINFLLYKKNNYYLYFTPSIRTLGTSLLIILFTLKESFAKRDNMEHLIKKACLAIIV